MDRAAVAQNIPLETAGSDAEVSDQILLQRCGARELQKDPKKVVGIARALHQPNLPWVPTCLMEPQAVKEVYGEPREAITTTNSCQTHLEPKACCR